LELGDALPSSRKRLEWLRGQAESMTVRVRDADEPGRGRTDHEPGALAARLANRILDRVLPSNVFQSLLAAPGDAEVDFALAVGSWTIVGRFDRLIADSDGQLEIVDWKTDEAAADEVVARYRPQMKLYALALLECAPPPKRPKRIVVHLAMTHGPSVERLVFTAEELAAYRAELAAQLGS
jgi:hypothetical protein